MALQRCPGSLYIQTHRMSQFSLVDGRIEGGPIGPSVLKSSWRFFVHKGHGGAKYARFLGMDGRRARAKYARFLGTGGCRGFAGMAAGIAATAGVGKPGPDRGRSMPGFSVRGCPDASIRVEVCPVPRYAQIIASTGVRKGRRRSVAFKGPGGLVLALGGSRT